MHVDQVAVVGAERDSHVEGARAVAALEDPVAPARQDRAFHLRALEHSAGDTDDPTVTSRRGTEVIDLSVHRDLEQELEAGAGPKLYVLG